MLFSTIYGLKNGCWYGLTSATNEWWARSQGVTARKLDFTPDIALLKSSAVNIHKDVVVPESMLRR